jgi:pantothenate kinase
VIEHEAVEAGAGATAERLARRIRELAASRPGRTIVGIVGAPGAGKSTLTEAVAARLPEGLAVVVPMDGFHLGQSILDGTELAARKGAPDTFDVGGYVALLRRLRLADEDVVYAPTFRRSIEEPVAASIAVPRGVPVVLTEGNYLLADDGRWGEVRGLLDEVWFVDVPEELRRERLVERHVAFGRSRRAAEEWTDGPDAANARLVAATRSRADRFVAWS